MDIYGDIYTKSFSIAPGATWYGSASALLTPLPTALGSNLNVKVWPWRGNTFIDISLRCGEILPLKVRGVYHTSTVPIVGLF